MKKAVFPLLLFFSILGCDEEQESASPDCYLSRITRSNAQELSYKMENKKVVQIAYDGTESSTQFIYDSGGRLISIISEGIEIRYEYNADGRVTLAETSSHGEVVSTTEYTYESGYPVFTFTIDHVSQSEQWFSEIFTEYEDGNPVRRTRYGYTSSSPGKGDPQVTVIRYDKKKNPFLTHNFTTSEPVVNNPVEISYEDHPEHNTLITYTYNRAGYPVDYRITYPNSNGKNPDVTGTYYYACDGN